VTNGMERLGVLRERSLALLEKTHSGALLLARLGVGLLFLSTGWGKVHSIPKVTGFFMSLGIPLPGLNAVVVAYSELLCGTALVVGLFARLATVPLIVSMIVAILTAKRRRRPLPRPKPLWALVEVITSSRDEHPLLVGARVAFDGRTMSQNTTECPFSDAGGTGNRDWWPFEGRDRKTGDVKWTATVSCG
jgi:uncharacterized membrane protein YphA (DoxX/SURF4 family)